MAQAPRQLTPHESPRHFFGAELRRLRERHGLSQSALGQLIYASGAEVARIEKAERWPSEELARDCDDKLATDGILSRLWPLVEMQRRNSGAHVDSSGIQPNVQVMTAQPSGSSATMTLRVDEEGNVWGENDRRTFLVASAAMLVQQATGVGGAGHAVPESAWTGPADPFGFADAAATAWPGLQLSRPSADFGGVDWHVMLPGGRNMVGAETAVQIHPARLTDGTATLSIPDSRRADAFLSRSGRGMLIGAAQDGDSTSFFVLESREAQNRLRKAQGVQEVMLPTAYELDDFTYGILWAVSNLDDALQADDQALHETRHDLKAYERLSASAVSREAAPGLNPIAHMYLGSDFCAGHILKCLPDLSAKPTAWTREQRGEEASTWLLFDHKYPYLRETVAIVGGTMERGFCIPEDAVTTSPRYERVLLFLAIALMESIGIHVQLTTDPAYENVEGFVLAPQREAIIANWVRGDGMWHVDLTGRSTLVRQFGEVAGDVGTRSHIEAPSPARRLEALADFLNLEWSWLVRRSAELARRGTYGLVQGRSRLISSAGLDAACAFVGSLQHSA